MSAPRASRLFPSGRAARTTLPLLLVLSLLAAGCSGAVDEALADAADDLEAAAAEVEQAAGEAAEDVEQVEEVAEVGDVDCVALLTHRMSYVQIAGTLGVHEEPSAPLEIHGESGFALAEEAIAAFRPYQDVQPEVFGPIREGLDNLENDIQAVRDGSFTGATGGYSSVAIAPVLATLGC